LLSFFLSDPCSAAAAAAAPLAPSLLLLKDGKTARMLAIEKGHLDIAAMVLSDNDAMINAVREGDKPECERLLAKDEKLKDAKNKVRKKGNTQRSMK
jgi:hypothetical protein